MRVLRVLMTSLMPRMICLQDLLDPMYRITNPSRLGCVARAQIKTTKLSISVNPEAVTPNVAVPVQVAMKRRYRCCNVSFSDFASLGLSIGTAELVPLRERSEDVFESIVLFADRSQMLSKLFQYFDPPLVP